MLGPVSNPVISKQARTDSMPVLALHKFPIPGLRVPGASVDVGEGAWRFASEF